MLLPHLAFGDGQHTFEQGQPVPPVLDGQQLGLEVRHGFFGAGEGPSGICSQRFGQGARFVAAGFDAFIEGG